MKYLDMYGRELTNSSLVYYNSCYYIVKDLIPIYNDSPAILLLGISDIRKGIFFETESFVIPANAVVKVRQDYNQSFLKKILEEIEKQKLPLTINITGDCLGTSISEGDVVLSSIHNHLKYKLLFVEKIIDNQKRILCTGINRISGSLTSLILDPKDVLHVTWSERFWSKDTAKEDKIDIFLTKISELKTQYEKDHNEEEQVEIEETIEEPSLKKLND